MPWGVEFMGKLQGRHRAGLERVPFHVAGFNSLAFNTRDEARNFIRKHYGQIATNKVLRGAPHFWRMPKPVKIKITIGIV